MKSSGQRGDEDLLGGGKLRLARSLFFFFAVIVLVGIGLGLFQEEQSPFSQIRVYGGYFFLGILGAVIANSTGAGGGIVFLPFFGTLGFTFEQSIGTSFAIQCFGMTAGAFAWSLHLKEESSDHPHFDFRKILLLSAMGSLLGLKGAQVWISQAPVDVKLLFSLFSIIVGLLILWRTLSLGSGQQLRSQQLQPKEIVGLLIVSLLGGAITAWLSVGVGELIALYLIGLHCRVNDAVALAVCVSSVTVLAGLPPFLAQGDVIFGVLTFAATGALIGGTLAKHLAVAVGARRLKVGLSLWIIVSSVAYLVIQ